MLGSRSKRPVGARSSNRVRLWLREAVMALLATIAASSATAQLSIVSLTSTQPKPFGHFGWTVADAGDVDGDGRSDVVVGAPNEDGESINDGRAYVFGTDGSLLAILTSPNAQINGSFGIAVAGLGDLDGDGLSEVAVGASRENEDGGPFTAGKVYVFRGADGTALFELSSPNPESGGAFGASLAAAGDVDGDGLTDLLVGAHNEAGGAADAGRAYVFRGANGALLHTLESPNPEATGFFANAVAGAGDVDGDGFDDLLVGAWSETGGGVAEAGSAYLFRGSDGSLLRTLASPDPETQGFFGKSVSGAGDIDGDGLAEVLVGAYLEQAELADAGRAHVFRGSDGSPLLTLTSPEPQLGGRFGEAVGLGPDLDGDGLGEWVVTAAAEDGDAIDEGRAYLFRGSNGTLLGTLSSPTPAEFGLFGFSAAGIGSEGILIGTFAEDGAGFGDGQAHLFLSELEPLDLVVSGRCPGEISIQLSDQTPNAPIVLLAALREGETPLPGGPCAGTVVDLASPRRLVELTAGVDGSAEITRTIDEVGACAALLQAVDLATCEPSNTAPVTSRLQ